MKTKAMCIMLVDDDKNDNFFHEREIKKNNIETIVIVEESGTGALKYLKSMIDKKKIEPALIFLDINMPGMNGWEFLEEYNNLPKEIQSKVMIIMLTTSVRPEDIERAESYEFVLDYITKPLTKEKMKDINDKYFK
ncbi:MAG: hypothetical protein COW71_16105 [Ignavibacteriales bacterium CG18_big_fil_WC_8_21_14_2_50_31_20]|nr:MAG: hypothetical protein COW71_16105 [Ignavibacteriales bacterium CG18_big_fil_WC_8_21_14_2_50_31_20]